MLPFVALETNTWSIQDACPSASLQHVSLLSGFKSSSQCHILKSEQFAHERKTRICPFFRPPGAANPQKGRRHIRNQSTPACKIWRELARGLSRNRSQKTNKTAKVKQIPGNNIRQTNTLKKHNQKSKLPWLTLPVPGNGVAYSIQASGPHGPGYRL